MFSREAVVPEDNVGIVGGHVAGPVLSADVAQALVGGLPGHADDLRSGVVEPGSAVGTPEVGVVEVVELDVVGVACRNVHGERLPDEVVGVGVAQVEMDHIVTSIDLNGQVAGAGAGPGGTTGRGDRVPGSE